MKYTFAALICLIFVFSCKKEKKEELVAAPPPAQTGTTATDSIPVDTLSVANDSCYGEFMLGRYLVLLPNNSLQMNGERPSAVFQSAPCLYTNMPSSGIGIDSIIC